MVWRAPYWLPISISFVLLIGSILNNFELDVSGIDLLLTLACFFTLLFTSRLKSRQTVSILSADPQFFFRIISLFTIAIALIHYSIAGLPLLSSDPNVARMEFMQSTWIFKVLKIFVPFMIIYAMAQLISNTKNKVENLTTLILLILIQLASGGKGAAIWCAIFLALGHGATNGKLKARILIVGSIIFLAPTIILFKFVGGIENWGEVFYFLLKRLTGVAEYGLIVVTDYTGDDISWWTPLAFLSDLLLKITGQLDIPYTLSFGRRVTGAFYGGDPYAYIWELTVTAVADLYVLFGPFGYLPALLLYAYLFRWLSTKIVIAGSLYSKCGWLTIWYHFSLYILTGSLTTELVVRTLPFIIFWSLGALTYTTLFKSRKVL